MEAMTDPEFKEVSFLKSARVGYTKMIDALIGYHIHRDPCGILVVQPTVEDAEGFSKEEIAPMFRDVPVLSDIVGDPKARDSGQTILKKTLPGMALHMTGANSARGFRRITTRLFIADELSGWPHSTSEGDQLILGRKRTEDAWNPKWIYGSTPGDEGFCKISKQYERSDKRVYHVPCPLCDHGQALRFGGKDCDYGLKWDGRKTEDTYYLCEHCHGVIEESHKPWMLEQGLWHREAPEVKNHAGFRIWAAYSVLPGAAWGLLAAEWLEAIKRPDTQKAYTNTTLGETWKLKYSTVKEDDIKSRREAYPADAEGTRLVPAEVAIITAGVDTHDDRLEVQIDGWGLDEECWKLGYHVLYGMTSNAGVWADLLEVLQRPLRMERGGVDYIRATAIDTAGHSTAMAYKFCKPRYQMKMGKGKSYVWGIVGRGGPGLFWPKQPSLNNKGKLPLFTVKVDKGKENIYARLVTQSKEDLKTGPGVIHFPLDFGDRYFEQLTSEKCITTADKAGNPIKSWELKSEGRRNEAFDTAVYSYAALSGLQALGLDLNKLAEEVNASLSAELKDRNRILLPQSDDQEIVPVPVPDPPKKKRTRRTSRSKFLGR